VQTKTVKDLPAEVALHHLGDKDTAPLIKHNTEQAAAQDLMALLQLVEMGKIGVNGKTGRVSKTGAKAIRKVLSRKDFYPADIAAPNEFDVRIGEVGIRPFAWPIVKPVVCAGHDTCSKK
jgi:hypothetical protein